MMRAIQNAVWMGLSAIVLTAPASLAQQGQPAGQENQQPSPDQASGPVAAYRSPFASAADNGGAGDESQGLAPDTHALSGAQNLTLGIPTARNYWQPRFDANVTADSNAQETPQNTGWGTWTSVAAGVDVHHTSGSNDMILSYTSGGMFSNNSGVSNGIVQILNVVDTFAFRRSSLTVFDSLNYLPESSLGFGGLGGNALPGGGNGGLGSTFTTGQSVLTGQGQNLGNSFATEVDTYLTPRTSLTFVGGYTSLHYFDSDLLNSGAAVVRAGYNYEVSRKDTVAVFYTFSAIRYSNFDQSINDHAVQFSYARRATGRLAFQVAIGPQIAFSRFPFLGGAGSPGGGGGTSETNSIVQVSWVLNSAMQYQLERAQLGFSYNHALNAGSGVLAGSVADIVTGSVSRQVSRTFSSGINAGYSRNQGLVAGSTTPSGQTYDYWFAGASLAHPVGRSLGLTASYQLQYQNSNAPFCVGVTCGTSVIRHLITVGFGWHERPILF